MFVPTSDAASRSTLHGMVRRRKIGLGLAFMANTHGFNDNMWVRTAEREWPSTHASSPTSMLSSANSQRKAHPSHHIVPCSLLAFWIRDENAVDETSCSIGEIASTVKHHVRFGAGNRKKSAGYSLVLEQGLRSGQVASHVRLRGVMPVVPLNVHHEKSRPVGRPEGMPGAPRRRWRW